MLGREGANLALGGRDREKLEALEEEIHASGGQALVVGVHLAKRHHPAHLVEAAVAEFGGLDALLFMARASAPPLNSMDLDAWERSVDVNLKGFLYTVAAALPAMREGGGGHVVCLDAEAPRVPDPLYRASRAAGRVLLQEIAREFSGEGIRTSEVTLGDPSRTDPERCAGVIRCVLTEPSSAGFATRNVPEA
jgi:NADP-dependent 3-hydroxy acid dehydrogenase YdfG